MRPETSNVDTTTAADLDKNLPATTETTSSKPQPIKLKINPETTRLWKVSKTGEIEILNKQERKIPFSVTQPETSPKLEKANIS